MSVSGVSNGRVPFRLRGEQSSRIEAFSDGVFAFALTLLVMSLEVPKRFDDLMMNMRGFLAFGVCFAILMWLWQRHHAYFRRYGLRDSVTVVLNGLLLFVILMYVYPLRFLFWLLLGADHDPARIAAAREGTFEQARQLFVLYGVGFLSVHAIFALMYAHALARRRELELNRLELFDTRERIVNNLLLAGLGVVSLGVVWLAPPRWMGWAGWTYLLMGVVEFFNGLIRGIRREKLERAFLSGKAV